MSDAVPCTYTVPPSPRDRLSCLSTSLAPHNQPLEALVGLWTGAEHWGHKHGHPVFTLPALR